MKSMRMSNSLMVPGVFGLLLAIALSAGFARVRQLKLELADMEARAGQAATPGPVMGDLTSEVSTLRKSAEEFRRQVPFQPDISVLLSELGSELPEDSTGEREIVMRPTVGGSTLNQNAVVLRMRSDCDDALALLRKIEGYRQLTRVSRVGFEKRSPDADYPPMLELEFVLYSQSTPEALSWSE